MNVVVVSHEYGAATVTNIDVPPDIPEEHVPVFILGMIFRDTAIRRFAGVRAFVCDEQPELVQRGQGYWSVGQTGVAYRTRLEAVVGWQEACDRDGLLTEIKLPKNAQSLDFLARRGIMVGLKCSNRCREELECEPCNTKYHRRDDGARQSDNET